jgi:hypothetical protein
VIVPINNANETAVLAFTSTNGGTSWGSTVTVASISHHAGAGKVYVVWSDSRFERAGRANDLVMSTSTNGTSWTAVTRIPADPVGSGVDHFIPGMAVDRSTSGTTAHLVVAFYYYPVSKCSSSTCKLDVGYVSSTNGGSSWSSTTNITGPMTLSWLPNTTQGRMVGDYISADFAGGTIAFPAFAVASAPTGGTDCSVAGVTCHEATFSVVSGLALARGANSSRGDRVLSSSPASSTPLTSR